MKILNSFHLKLIAIITMFIDHIGMILYPSNIVLRIIGRVAFVLFAFQLVESMHYSKHKIKYILRLFIIDLVLIIVAFVFMKQYEENIFGLLAISSLIIYLLDKEEIYLKPLALIPCAYIVFSTFNFTFFNVQYGIYGLALILSFYFARKGLEIYINANYLFLEKDSLSVSTYLHRTYTLICAISLLTISLICKFFPYFFTTYFPANSIDYEFQTWALIAIPFILLYNGKRGYDSKCFRVLTYLSYPLSLLIPYLISLII